MKTMTIIAILSLMSYLLRSLGGRPELWVDSELAYRQLGHLLLVTYLSQSGETTRLDVSDIFWPNLEKQDRLARLSEVLRIMKKFVPGAVIKSEAESSLRVNVVSEVEQLKDAANKGNYEEVLRLYRGHFLHNVEKNQRSGILDNSELYDWLTAEREAILDITRTAIERYGEIKAIQGYYSEGNALVLKAFKLRTEQSVLLPLSYQKIYTVLRAGQSLEAEAIAREAVELYGIESITLYDNFQDARRQLSVPNNLPVASSLIGREHELATCASLLKNETRLLTLLGTGGAGKSTLGLALARNLLGYENFKDGVYALWLEPLSDPKEVVTSIAHCLNINLSGKKTPIDTVADAINDQAILLYLDNFEHLLEAISNIDQLLARCPNLRIVLSSREVVISDWSKLYDLHGLDFPDENTVYDFEDVATYAAVELVVAQGKRVSNSFELTEDNFEAVVDICQQVGGLALGLKLAASWLHSSSVQAISEELKGSMALLDKVQHNQRGVSAALELSWQRLTEAEQDAFCKLAVFNGGFNLLAAQSICEIELTELRSLQNKSLIEWDAGKERYSLHPLIRRFVELKAEASVLEGLKLKHSAYYLKLLRVITHGTQEERNGAVRLLKPEVYNIQDAWQQAIDNQDLDELQNSAHAVERLFDELAKYYAGNQLLQNAVDSLSENEIAQHETLGSVLASQAWLQIRLLNYPLAINLAENALKVRKDDFQTESTALNVLGASHHRLGNYSLAKKYYEQGLVISENHRGHYATTLVNLGIIERKFGKFDLAEKYYEEVLTILQEENQQTRLPSLWKNLGLLNLDKNDLGQAAVCFKNGLDVSKVLENDREIYRFQMYLGCVQFCQGNYDGLETLFRDIFAQAKKQKYTILENDLLISLTRLYFAQGNYIEALRYLEKIIQNHEKSNTSYHIYKILLSFLLVCKDIDFEKSQTVYSLLYKPNNFKKIEYITKVELEDIELNSDIQGDFGQIVEHKLEEVYTLVKRWGFPHLL